MLKFVPFERYELAQLKKYQQCHLLQPYRCPRCQAILEPRTQGLECPSCNFTQIYYQSGSLELLDEATKVLKNVLKRKPVSNPSENNGNGKHLKTSKEPAGD